MQKLDTKKKKLLKYYADQIRKIFNKDFGHQCKEYSLGCIVCQVHKISDDVDTVADFYCQFDE